MDSKLQIISGEFRGRKLVLPTGVARPTQNRARIALFNMLMPMLGGVNNLVVWDAFAGSGAFGIELLSRFANAHAIFTDTDIASIRALRRNIAGMDARATIDNTDALRAISKYAHDANVIFIDPPYAAAGLGGEFVTRIAGTVRSGTIVIWEQDNDKVIMPDDKIWDIVRDKQYGRARFFILIRREM